MWIVSSICISSATNYPLGLYVTTCENVIFDWDLRFVSVYCRYVTNCIDSNLPFEGAWKRKRRDIGNHLGILERLRKALNDVAGVFATAGVPVLCRWACRNWRRRRRRSARSNLAPVLEQSADILPGKEEKNGAQKIHVSSNLCHVEEGFAAFFAITIDI